MSVSISLDGGSPEVHDSLRGLRGSFDKATKALILLAERGSETQIIMALSRRNLNEVEQVLEIASKHKCSLVKLNPVNTLGTAQRLKRDEILLDPAECIIGIPVIPKNVIKPIA